MMQSGINFNPEWSIRVNVDHILGDAESLERIPPRLRKAKNLPLLLETAVELARRKAIIEPGLVVPQGYQCKLQYLIPILITKYADLARENTDMLPEKVTPHTFRHIKAMHLCQAGIDMIYIRDILGHARISTTEIYAKINVEQMRDALERAYPELNPKVTKDWNDDNSLMNFLNSL